MMPHQDYATAVRRLSLRYFVLFFGLVIPGACGGLYVAEHIANVSSWPRESVYFVMFPVLLAPMLLAGWLMNVLDRKIGLKCHSCGQSLSLGKHVRRLVRCGGCCPKCGATVVADTAAEAIRHFAAACASSSKPPTSVGEADRVENRSTARHLCGEAMARGEPLAWFDQLYSMAAERSEMIPWADLEPNPNLIHWHRKSLHRFDDQRCLKIGCGLGDDCEYLRQAGGIVTGFDISPAAIAWCKRRFPQSNVRYVAQDLFTTPDDWAGAYDFVLESYTLQVLPPDMRMSAIAAIARFVAKDGTLLVIARARDETDPVGLMPWPLTKQELHTFGNHGLTMADFDEYRDNENPPVRRFLATFKRT